MAVYGWIYANAKIRGDRGDYLVRWCDSALERYEDMLTSLSRGMLATTKRYGQAEAQECWLFGFLDKGRRCPVVAVAGEQERLLGMPLSGGGFRKQYCVLAWGFDGGDIRLCKRDDGIFEPLKEVLREIQRTGKTAEPGEWEMGAGDSFIFCSGQQAMEDSIGPESNFCAACPPMACNIVNSGPEDDKLWETSLGSKPQRPVMTGILGVEEAKRMLDLFPDGVVTVIEGIGPQYYSPQKEKNVWGSKTGNGVKAESGNKAGNRKKAGNEETANAVKEISRQAAKRQILDKEKEEKERRKIIECAKRCREALDKKTVEDILDAVRQMGLKDGFSQQMRFFGCMYLWRSIYLGQGTMKSRREISYFLEAWRERVKNKNGAFQANKIMADEVMGLMGRRR